ncbi:MAG: DUF1688 family protein [Bdellovibrionia bacterium]
MTTPDSQIQVDPQDIDYLLSPQAVRERSQMVFDLATKGQTHFKVNHDRLDTVADYVLEVIRENYPDLRIPFHSRNNHLNAGKIDRLGRLEKMLSGKAKTEIAKSKIDLIVVSVLLDAGAGDRWTYQESGQPPGANKIYSRSEGLAVASFHMFQAGGFSSDKSSPLQADIQGLKNIMPFDLERYFQVKKENPLAGVEGRVYLLNALAIAMEKQPAIFKNGRIGDLLDHLTEKHGNKLKAAHVLDFVLRTLGEIWPSRLRLRQQNLGDVWSYKNTLIPFHKLSQWLSYSLLVPMMEAGIEITDVHELTGLPEYRNGGLLLDLGFLELKNPELLTKKHEPHSDVIVEWRALTVTSLDLIGDAVRKKLGLMQDELPLAKVLEGGTWHAGRKIAKEKRPGGEPPLNIVSDGTVF